MKKIDYLIVGQGIAGTVLSYTLLQKGKHVLVVDQDTENNASKAASGVCNPITGRRLVKTWKADVLFPFLHTFYKQLQAEIGGDFFHPKEVYRTFSSTKEQNDWFAKTEEAGWKYYVNTEIDHSTYAKFIDNQHGGWETRGAAHIDVAKMLEAYQGYLDQRGILQRTTFAYQDLRIENGRVLWQEIEASKVIFCEGAQAIHNPYFRYLPFRPDKGEWLKVRIAGAALENLIKQNVFIIPLGEEEFLISGTYHQGDLSYQTTEKARQELSQKLDKVLKLPYEILDQRAGIRAATKHRRPFFGLHPKYPPLAIFNGLGTKGLSLSPYFALQFYEHLENGKALDEEVDIQRYETSVDEYGKN